MLNALGLDLPEASLHAANVDRLIFWFSVLAAALTIPVFLAIIGFAIRYRVGKQVNREHARDRNVWLEVSWSLIPFLLIIGFFVVAASMFFSLHAAPSDALEVSVVAKQWMWKARHPEGQAEIDELHVPIDTPVLLTMTSQDVIHSFYVPALRIKQDVLPGRYTQMTFTATRAGRYHLFCAEYCGTDHAVMGGSVIVMPAAAYGGWLAANRTGRTMAQQGGELFRSLGCAACHAPGAAVAAPPLDHVADRPVPLADGRMVQADDAYLRRAILMPNAEVVQGYRPIMPTYRGAASEEDVMKLIAWLRTPPEARR